MQRKTGYEAVIQKMKKMIERDQHFDRGDGLKYRFRDNQESEQTMNSDKMVVRIKREKQRQPAS